MARNRRRGTPPPKNQGVKVPPMTRNRVLVIGPTGKRSFIWRDKEDTDG